MLFVHMPVETIQYIATKVDPRGFDALRGASHVFRSCLDPFDFSMHANPIAYFVSRVSRGGWCACKRRLARAALHNTGTFVPECLSMCVFKEAGFSLKEVQMQYEHDRWIQIARSFLTLCGSCEASHVEHVERFVSKCSEDQLHAALSLIWGLH